MFPLFIFTKIHPVATGGVLCRMTDRKIDMTKLMVAFRICFAEGNKKKKKKRNENVAHYNRIPSPGAKKGAN